MFSEIFSFLFNICTFKSNLLDQFKENNFIESLLNEIKKQLSSWELPNRTTVKGYTTKGNLSNLGLKNLSKLEDFFDKEINQYKNNFSKSECLFIKNWPKNCFLNLSPPQKMAKMG